MNFENQIMFFFSALGAFNALLLAFYFAITAKKKRFSNYFLSGLLLTLSIRILKSVFFYFNPKLSGVFIQIGLSACILIGPFIYLYLKYFIKSEKSKWFVHIVTPVIGITLISLLYPYTEHRTVWSRWIVKGIYLQWFVYLILCVPFIKPIFYKFTDKHIKPTNIDVWLLSIFFGVTFIWLGYIVGSYTSYIVGALSFSFVLYLVILLLIFKRNKYSSFFEEPEKYKNKAIKISIRKEIETKIFIVKENGLFQNPNVTLSDVAEELNVSAHILSQYLNDDLGKPFTTFINEFRIEKAKTLLLQDKRYTIEALGYESGFNSKSTFNTTFKKICGCTPSEYRAEHRG